jgi:hypothetical protein
VGTYDYKQVLSDYEKGKMDVEMAMGHTLQHIGKLYEAQLSTHADQQQVRQTVNTLQTEVSALQTEITRLPKLQAALVQLQQVVDRLIAHTGLTLPKSSKRRRGNREPPGAAHSKAPPPSRSRCRCFDLNQKSDKQSIGCWSPSRSCY